MPRWLLGAAQTMSVSPCKQQSTAGAPMRHEEIEVKFLIADLAAMRQRLMALGATLKTPPQYEPTWFCDPRDEQPPRQGRLLRLRRDRRNLITYKEPPAQQDPDFKVLQEYEIEVSDFAQARTILEKLGFTAALRYEKYRETFIYHAWGRDRPR